MANIEPSAKIIVRNVEYRAQEQKTKSLMSKQCHPFVRRLLGNIAASKRIVTVAERKHKFISLLAYPLHARFKAGIFKRGIYGYTAYFYGAR